jgi:hypothetical protein
VGGDLEHVYEEEESDELWALYKEPIKTYAEQESSLFHRTRAHFRTFVYVSGFPASFMPCTQSHLVYPISELALSSAPCPSLSLYNRWLQSYSFICILDLDGSDFTCGSHTVSNR